MILKGALKKLYTQSYLAQRFPLAPNVQKQMLTQSYINQRFFSTKPEDPTQGGEKQQDEASATQTPRSKLFQKRPPQGQQPEQEQKAKPSQPQQQRQDQTQHQQRYQQRQGDQRHGQRYAQDQRSQPQQQQQQPQNQGQGSDQFQRPQKPHRSPQQEFASPFLKEGEYIEEDCETFIGTKVGEFTFTQKSQLSPTLAVEEILSGDIYEEHQANIQNSINQNYKKFSEKYGIKEQESKEQPSQSSTSTSTQLDGFREKFKEAFLATGFSLPNAPERRQQISTNRHLDLESEVKASQENLQNLLKSVGQNHSILSSIKEIHLRNSRELRNSLQDYKEFYFFTADKLPQEFTKKYESQEQEKVDIAQSFEQSQVKEHINTFAESAQRNIPKFQEFLRGEEGVDYQVMPANIQDPNEPSEKQLEKQLRRELNIMKLDNPGKAKQFQKYFFERNEIDDMINKEVDLSLIKTYPGSAKGPRPEDDMENYSKWFVENQPDEFYEGRRKDFADLGVKRKYISLQRDVSENNEIKTPSTYFLEDEGHDLYYLQSYQGLPEFSLFERDNYNVENDQELPSVAITTNLGVNELPPMPSEHTFDYQQFHPELEKWAIFRALPPMMAYDEGMLNFFKGLRNGTLKVPDFMNTINPPSLWAYYETLPKWAREHPSIRNVLMAFEYHKPSTPIRQKEMAMNYAMSFIRPIDKDLEDVIIEIATSNKIRLNIARGKEMINQLKFYELDPEDLGSDTEQEDEHQKQQMAQQAHEDKQASLQFSKGVDEDEEELTRQRTAMERFASGLDEDSRDREKSIIMEKEMSITEYQVEPEMEKVLTDFYVLPYPEDIHEPDAQEEPMIPLNYYDNDDGFWDEYIQMKNNKWGSNQMMVNRVFLKH